MEVDVAKRSGRPIITLMIEPPEKVLGAGVPAETAIDFSVQENYEKSLATLLEILEATTGSAPQEAPAVEEPAPPEAPIEQKAEEVGPGFVFLSYAREDSEVAQALRREIERAGVRVWGGWVVSSMMEDTEEGRSRKEIELSTVFVALLSRHTLDQSGWRLSRIERDHAAQIVSDRGPSGLMILPVALDDTNFSEAGLPDAFYRTDWFHLRSDEDRRRLVQALREIVRERGPAPSSQAFA